MTDVYISCGDITAWAVDAIVNAANNDLVLGSGVAGAIARRGGPQIQKECDEHGPIEVGQAAITSAGDLPAKHVIHQASMTLGSPTEPQNLRSSTSAALALAKQHELKSIAFPATGTGVGGLDMAECAEIMLDEVHKHVQAGTTLTDIHFVLFDDAAGQAFKAVAERMFGVQET
jgi:O-acetyl-ADP-ribose deacetylase (regulator of RNase III)